MMHILKPVEIFFSQDSINNTFDRKSRHNHKLIGETLDDICEGRCSVNNVPTISVAERDGRWVTADNRRLWVFRHLYRLNKCDTVRVNRTFSIPPRKMTSNNKGLSIEVRGDPGGQWHRQRSIRVDTPILPTTRPATANWGSNNSDEEDSQSVHIQSTESTPRLSTENLDLNRIQEGQDTSEPIRIGSDNTEKQQESCRPKPTPEVGGGPVAIPRRSDRKRKPPDRFDEHLMYQVVNRPVDPKLSAF